VLFYGQPCAAVVASKVLSVPLAKVFHSSLSNNSTAFTSGYCAKLLGMLTTYEAILRDNLLEWRNDAPRHLAPTQAVNVYVTVLEEPVASSQNQGQRMVEALEQLARLPITDGVDAVAWQRKIRDERAS
jgi:hypothetical protein